ncbi:MAG: hypothetical protein M1281_19255 [Chloroflexi bacterium]|nr:hypothetical protein [Chloroflexota bacterium]
MKTNTRLSQMLLRMTCYFLIAGMVLGVLLSFTVYGTQANTPISANPPVRLAPLSLGPLVLLGESHLTGQAGGGNKVFLPMLTGSGNPGLPTPTPQPTATPPPQNQSSSFFLPYDVNGDAQATDGPSVAIDANNGVHVAYAAYTSNASGQRPVYYTYCASNCTSVFHFSTPILLGDKVDHVNLALDPAGHPRLLWIGSDTSGVALDAIYYAECNASCTSVGSWAVTTLVKMDTTLPHNSRFFGVDPQGHPGFVYYNGDQYYHNTYYRFCKTSCTNPANWSEVPLANIFPESDRELRGISLAFASDGSPRIAAALTDYTAGDNPPTHLFYIQCGADCQTESIGGAFDLHYCDLCEDTDGYFNLRLDKLDRPRLALYTGGIQNTAPVLEANRLYYIYCNNNCSDNSIAEWGGYYLGSTPGVGQGVDLALDSSGRPRLSFEDASVGLEYAFCTGDCESGTPTWQIMLADSSANLDLTEPVPPIPPCVTDGWFTGKRSSLALDTAGNPRLAFDAEHWQGLNPVSNPPGSPACPGFRMDEINARLAVFNQP